MIVVICQTSKEVIFSFLEGSLIKATGMVICTLPPRHTTNHKMLNWNLKIRKIKPFDSFPGEVHVTCQLDPAWNHLGTGVCIGLACEIFFFNKFTFCGCRYSLCLGILSCVSVEQSSWAQASTQSSLLSGLDWMGLRPWCPQVPAVMSGTWSCELE